MLRTRNFFASALVLGFAAAASAPASANDIVDIAAGNADFETLVAAVTAAELVDTLKSEGPFTVFAPTDDAFAALPEGTVENLLKPENKDDLIAVLTYHVVPGKVMSTDLTDDMTAATVQGTTVTIDLDGGAKVNDANIVAADIEADNGVIHVIDKVILPGS
ncbi:MAG: fasciclin domain-containing protein [Pseudomonadota bacterium]